MGKGEESRAKGLMRKRRFAYQERKKRTKGGRGRSVQREKNGKDGRIHQKGDGQEPGKDGRSGVFSQKLIPNERK